MHGFQLSEKEAKEPNVILKHLQAHFMARKGLLTERTKFAHMKQEDQESVTALEERVKQQDIRAVSKVTHENFQEQAATDPALQKLSLLMMTGWLTVKTSVDPLVRPYYTFKDELSVADGIVYKGQETDPSSMRPAMFEKIHKTHFGVCSCIRRAKVSSSSQV